MNCLQELPDARLEAVSGSIASMAALGEAGLLPREVGALDLYDADGRLIGRIAMAGTHGSLAIDLAHVVPEMLARACHAVVLRHCHPSGIAWPSEADLRATRAFAGLLKLLGMRLHDHVIEGIGPAFSFRARGLV